MQAIYHIHAVQLQHSPPAYQEKISTTAYSVVIYPLHNILLAISLVDANASWKKKNRQIRQNQKNLVLWLTHVI